MVDYSKWVFRIEDFSSVLILADYLDDYAMFGSEFLRLYCLGVFNVHGYDFSVYLKRIGSGHCYGYDNGSRGDSFDSLDTLSYYAIINPMT